VRAHVQNCPCENIFVIYLLVSNTFAVSPCRASLPAFQFSNETSESLRGQMLSLFSQAKHDDVAQCIAKYGAYTSGNEPSLAAGINSLCKRFDDICNNFYGNDYVFEVVLNQIRQDQDDGLLRRALDAQQKITVNQIIKELRMEIPKTYLHIPDTMAFIVDKQELTFKYWHDRLVEFTCFTVKVGSTVPWKQNFEVRSAFRCSYLLSRFPTPSHLIYSLCIIIQ